MDRTLPERLIDAIYDAALDRALWPEALTRIGELFGGVATQLSVCDLATGDYPLGIGVGFVSNVWEIARRYATIETNPMLAIAMRIPLHHAIDQGAALGIGAFKTMPVYDDLYLSQRFMPLFGTVVARTERMFSGLALMRPDHWPQADPATLALGERVSIHVGRAVALAGLTAFANEASTNFEAALAQTQTPTMLLDDEGILIWTNAAADALLRAPDGLGRRRRRLVATDPADDARLTALLTGAVRGQDAALTIGPRPPLPPLVVRASPLWRSQMRAGAQVLVQVTEARPRFRFAVEEAADLFKLTPAEARVACELCAGARSLGEVAATLAVTVNTVKTLLQRVYDKTGVRAQEELVSLLAAVLRPAGPIRK